MKKLFKLIGIIALSALIIFSMTNCDEEGYPGALGDTLTLSGIVYAEDPDLSDELGFSFSYDPYSGKDINLTEYITGSAGTITATGDFSFSMEAPNAEFLTDITKKVEEITGAIYTNVTISNKDVKIFEIDGLKLSGEDFSYLFRVYHENTIIKNTVTGVTSVNANSLSAVYYYVTDDVKITATGKNLTGEAAKDYFGAPINGNFGNINISLKKGWNIVKTSITESLTFTMNEEEMEASGSISISITAGDDHKLLWVLDGTIGIF